MKNILMLVIALPLFVCALVFTSMGGFESAGVKCSGSGGGGAGGSFTNNFSVDITDYKRTNDNWLTSSVMLTNNTNRHLEFCMVTVVLLNNGKIVTSKTRPFTSLEAGCFVTKNFSFGRDIGDFTHYKTSVSHFRW